MPRFLCLCFAFAWAVLPVTARQSATQATARNVILITIDGLRWQEFFGGADRDYFKRDRNGSGGEPERRFWLETKAERRDALMPFMWKTIATQGQVFGDPDAGSSSRVTN